MRVERIEASKHKKGRILLFLEDGACLKITEQELLDFGLRSGDELDEAVLGRLKEAAGVSNARAAAADLIGKRASGIWSGSSGRRGPARRRPATPPNGWRPSGP